ncbi:MAG: hypothetical protein LBL55_00100 [Propionibacteriaceae bacterium]|jgi:uncharacterized protein YukE|nr:hypothetical protein [Propionibacteriaceae bacterium]
MGLVGMNPEVVKSVGREITRQAQDLAASQRRIDGYVQQLARVWGGPDCQRFRRTWESQQRAQMSAATSALTELGAALAREAEEQIQTSQAGSTGGPGATTGGSVSTTDGPGDSPLEAAKKEPLGDFAQGLDEALDVAGLNDKNQAAAALRIKQIANVAPEPYKSLFLEHYEEFSYHNDSRGFYRPTSDEVHLDFTNEKNNPRGSYATFFHEFGHGVDEHESNSPNKYMSSDYEYNGVTLHDTLVQDVRDNIHKVASEIPFRLGPWTLFTTKVPADQAQHVTDALMNRTGTSGLSNAEVKVYNRVVDYFSQELRSADAEVASDLYGGVTGNVIHGGYGHWDGDGDGANDALYWYNSSDNSWKDTQQLEFFAGYFSQQITQDPGLKITQRLLPSSSALLDQMAADMKD